MVDEPALLERGVLTAPAEVWDLAVRRAEVIGRLATVTTVGHVAADAAAVEWEYRGGRCTRCWPAGEAVPAWPPI